MRSPRSRAALVAVVVLGLALGAEPAAVASVRATAAKASAVSTPRWSVVATTAVASSSSSGPLTVSLAADSFVSASNNGSTPIDGAYTVRFVATATGGAAAEVQQCSATWSESTNTCPGTITVVASTTAAATWTVPGYFPPGSGVRLRIHPVVSAPQETLRLSVAVTN
ncbi:hypothetical protein ACWKWC_01295 [Geodermatophilus nigrescens]